MSVDVERPAALTVEHRPGLPFPDRPRFSGWDHPTRLEGDIFDLEVVQGSVPRELGGRFYSIAPETQFSPLLGDDVVNHWNTMLNDVVIVDTADPAAGAGGDREPADARARRDPHPVDRRGRGAKGDYR